MSGELSDLGRQWRELTGRQAEGPETAERRAARRGRARTAYPGAPLALEADQVVHLDVGRLAIDDETFQIRLSSRPDGVLLDSIRSIGIQMPLIVRRHPTELDAYQIICGFRRANAARMLSLLRVPTVVRDLSDDNASVVAYMENEHRQTLRDLDRAHAMEKFRRSGRTTTEIGALFRLSRRQIQRIEGLLDYPQPLKVALNDETITTTQALVLWQAKRRLGEQFDLDGWIEIARQMGSVHDLKRAIRDEFPATRPRANFFERSDDGARITLNVQALRAASDEERQDALRYLRRLVDELSAES